MIAKHYKREWETETERERQKMRRNEALPFKRRSCAFLFLDLS